MKKFLSVLAMVTLMSTTACAAQNEIILSTVGAKSDELSVTQALQQRKSDRNFVDKDLTPAQMAKILWAANGINRAEKGKRVNPTALGVYSVEVYAVTREGIYLYDPAGHKLKMIAEGDYRAITTTEQEFPKKASVNLIFFETPEAWNSSSIIPPREDQISLAYVAVGTMVQSVALAAETEDLGNCVRGSINLDEFKKVTKLADNRTFLLAQSVGYTD